MSEPWTIEFFEDAGHSPVREFLNQLDRKTRARFDWSMQQLCERNVLARHPLATHVEGKIWELRQESQTNIFRILYVAAVGKRFVLLHGFQKKTQATPRREIEAARRRLARFEELERSGRNT
jgi:phage-related protein